MSVLKGSNVTLRAFLPDEVDEAMRRMQTIPATKLDEQAARERRQRLERSGSRNDWEILFAVEADGRLVGDAQARCPRFALPPGVWELGVELWDEADRGRGVGRESVALLTSHLFQEEEAIRVQATTDVDNASMRRVLEILGFTDEGVLRGFMPAPPGPPRDYEMYAITKADWEETREGWTPTS